MITEVDNKYWTIQYDEANQIILCEWKAEAEELNDELFKSEMRGYADIVEKYRAPKLLLNTRIGSYALAPDIQEWVATEIAPRTMGAGQRKMAIILSDNLFAQVSVEQMLEEGDMPTLMQQYFDDKEEAFAWLCED
ncbi:MAG: hypothetical protein JJT94_14855 [Bernardetiaceae bacterium]|nr:hypothetical protein [Bernardetiaceae bacterium]